MNGFEVGFGWGTDISGGGGNYRNEGAWTYVSMIMIQDS